MELNETLHQQDDNMEVVKCSIEMLSLRIKCAWSEKYIFSNFVVIILSFKIKISRNKKYTIQFLSLTLLQICN